MKTKKKFSRERCIKKMFAGFWIKFSCVDPIGDIDKPVNAKIGHKNSLIEIKFNDKRFYDDYIRILGESPLKWEVDIDMEFTKDGKTEIKGRKITIEKGRLKLRELNDDYLDVVEQMFEDAVQKNYINDYIKTNITQRVMG